MSKSVMIEVDETTKSILEDIENRMSKGTEHSIQGFKHENNTVLQAMSTQLNNRLQDLEKSQSKDLLKIKNQVEDLLDDMEDHFSEIEQALKGSTEEQVEAVTKVLKGATEQLVTDLNKKLDVLETSHVDLQQGITKLSSLPDTLQRSIQEVLAEMKTELTELQGNVKGQLDTTLDKQAEQVTLFSQKLETVLQSIEEKQHQNETTVRSLLESFEQNVVEQVQRTETKLLEQLQAKEEMKEMSERLSLLEKELKWANQPFYKKWFGKRGE